jgi:hypothetical protein
MLNTAEHERGLYFKNSTDNVRTLLTKCLCHAMHIPLTLKNQKHRIKDILVPAIFDVSICDFMVLLISLPLHILPKREIHREMQTIKLFLIFIPDILSLLEHEPNVHTLVHFILKQVRESTLK